VKLLTNLLTTGIALVEGVPAAEGWCQQYSKLLATPRSTEWGETFNVRSVPDVRKEQGGNTPHACIGMNSDPESKPDWRRAEA